MSESNYYTDLGQKLRNMRKAKKYTLLDMASKLNKSVATMSKYENGELAIAVDVLIDYCRILNVDIMQLLPETHFDERDLEILKYKNYFIEKLYVYWYNGEARKITCGVIINEEMSRRSALYMGVDNPQNPYKSDYIYYGTLSYTDNCSSYYFANTAPPFDKVYICLPALIKIDAPRIGLMSAVNSHYQNVALKALAVSHPAVKKDELIEILEINSEDIKILKRSNYFTVT